jgi:hypothetical protein
VTEQYNPQYIVKVDDDVYLRLDRLPHAVAQWHDISAGGMPACMCSAHRRSVAGAARPGGVWRVFSASPPIPHPRRLACVQTTLAA